jgi:GrpB-like predicted nucleotidyltransferase (UPF0157 family)
MQTITVVEYDPHGPTIFEQLRGQLWPVLQDGACAIEHVGSTAVPGLAAKPIIDISVIVASEAELPVVIARLATLGYQHLGTLGVAGREAFRRPFPSVAHNLYACLRDGLGVQNHLAVRDYLRSHPESVQAYGELKKRLARAYPHDMASYVAGKTELILGMLRAQGWPEERLQAIETANRAR